MQIDPVLSPFAEESSYLFYPQPNTSKLHLFSIEKKEINILQMDFTFTSYAGFCHINSQF